MEQYEQQNSYVVMQYLIQSKPLPNVMHWHSVFTLIILLKYLQGWKGFALSRTFMPTSWCLQVAILHRMNIGCDFCFQFLYTLPPKFSLISVVLLQTLVSGLKLTITFYRLVGSLKTKWHQKRKMVSAFPIGESACLLPQMYLSQYNTTTLAFRRAVWRGRISRGWRKQEQRSRWWVYSCRLKWSICPHWQFFRSPFKIKLIN